MKIIINIKYESSTMHTFKTLIVHVYSMIPMHELFAPTLACRKCTILYYSHNGLLLIIVAHNKLLLRWWVI